MKILLNTYFEFKQECCDDGAEAALLWSGDDCKKKRRGVHISYSKPQTRFPRDCAPFQGLILNFSNGILETIAIFLLSRAQ